MDKLILKMPKAVILKYLNDHFEEITENDYFDLLDNNIEVPYKLFEKNKELLKSEKVLQSAYLGDVRNIRYFDKTALTLELCKDAVKRGYIATEEDILFNPNLKDIAVIMKVAILHDPKLIKYVTKFCGIQMPEELINKTLSKYKITEEDLSNNPELCEIYLIMSYYPEYKYYYAYLSKEEKINAIKDCLINDNYNRLKNLPFLKKDIKFDTESNLFYEVINIFTDYPKNINYDDSSEYYEILNKVIDGIIEIKYKKDKNQFKYSDIVALNDGFINAFSLAKSSGSFDPINNLVEDIYQFVNMNSLKIFMNFNYIKEKVYELYNFYFIESKINRDESTLFYNEILNKHRNSYTSEKRLTIIENIKDKFKLSNKKITLIINGIKINQITNIFKNRQYEILETSREELCLLTKKVESEIASNRDLKKMGIIISEDKLNLLSKAFLEGELNVELISNLLNINNTEVIEFILKKYEHIKLNYLDKITLSEDMVNISSNIKKGLNFNINNFDIFNEDRYLSNVAKIIMELDEEIVKNLINYRDEFNYLKKLISFVNLFPEFNTKNYIRILNKYDQIRNKITENYYGFSESDEFLLYNFKNTIDLATGYNDVSSLYKIILGNEIVNKLKVETIKDYFEFYLKMLQKNGSHIPVINCEINGFSYISGDNTDPNRLLIGKNYKKSCIDLDSYSGRETFIECLLGDTGDVIIIKDLTNPKFFCRILLFRRGNVVQLAKLYDEKMNNIQLDDIVLEIIATQIITQSEMSKDNIDYVFVNADTLTKNSKFKKYVDDRFILEFPHADFESEACLLKSSSRVQNLDVLNNLNFSIPMKVKYFRKPKDISKSATEEELSKLKALKIAFEDDLIKKETLEKKYTPFYRDDYLEVVSGEDWYLAIDKNGDLETLLLPTNNPYTIMEFERVLEAFKEKTDKKINGIRRY